MLVAAACSRPEVAPSVVTVYRDGIDQAFCGFMTFSNGDPPIVIAKEYLEPRKQTAGSKASTFVTYKISQGSKESTLVQIPASEEHEVLKPTPREDGARVPVIRRGTLTEFFYSTKTREISVIESPESPDPRATRFSNGLAVAVSNGEAWLTAPGRPPAKLLGDAATSLQIVDTLESNKDYVVLGTGKNAIADFVWVSSINDLGGSFATDTRTLNFESATSISVNFIPSIPRRRAIIAHVRDKSSMTISTSILSERLELIWRGVAARPTDAGLAVVGVCSQKFAVLFPTQTGHVPDTIDFKVIDPRGNVVKDESHLVVSSGSLIDVAAAPLGESSLSVFANFEQTESVRRADGWYSWRGYQVRRIDVDCSGVHKDD